MDLPPDRIREAFASLTEEQRKNLYNKLRHYIGKYHWWIKGADADELIGKSFADALGGGRHWPSEIKFETFLCGVVRSNASQLTERMERENLQPLEDTSEDLINYEHYFSPHRENPYQQIAFQELCQKMLELVGDDQKPRAILELWIKDPGIKPKEIASMLGLSMQEMRCAQKRLVRRLAMLRKEGWHV